MKMTSGTWRRWGYGNLLSAAGMVVYDAATGKPMMTAAMFSLGVGVFCLAVGDLLDALRKP